MINVIEVTSSLIKLLKIAAIVKMCEVFLTYRVDCPQCETVNYCRGGIEETKL